jgi:hypothetical protein
MAVWIRKCTSFEEERRADREFWAQTTPEQRVAAVEELREHWSKQQGDGVERLRRVVRVVDLP